MKYFTHSEIFYTQHTDIWSNVLTTLTALSISASENMISGDFPPNSNDTFFTLLPAALDKMGGGANRISCSQSHQPHLFIMVFPTSVDPVKPILRTRGCSERTCPAIAPGPGTILTTPLGIPARTVNSANLRAVNGVTCK